MSTTLNLASLALDSLSSEAYHSRMLYLARRIVRRTLYFGADSPRDIEDSFILAQDILWRVLMVSFFVGGVFGIAILSFMQSR